MKFTKLAAAAALAIATVPGAAMAQDAAAAAVAGATVYGNDGGEIGTIDRVEGETAFLVVDGMTAPIPAAVVAAGEKGATINATKAQIVGMLQAAKAQQDAQRDAALVVGAQVSTVKGEAVGPITLIEGDKIVMEHNGGVFALTRNQFAIDNGKLVALVAMADIMAAVAANGGGATAEAEGAM